VPLVWHSELGILILNHDFFLFLIVLLLFPQCKMNYWWLVSWSWLVGSIILDLLDAHKWTGAELWKRPFRVMTFQPSSSNGARCLPIETNGVLFAVLKRQVLQKRHRPYPDKTTG
jgi:hypothetical protein